MGKKIVLLLQGGGALGAFQCGVWKTLFPFMQEKGHELVAVAGASIGAVNASLIARHYRDTDGGSGHLQNFWRSLLAVPPVPFFPLPGEYWRAWNGLLTGLLMGNRGLFHPAYQHWNPVGGMFRFQMPLYQMHNAEQTLDQAFGYYDGAAPLLAISATDIKSGEMVLFDSASRTITPKLITASIAIPILFSPVEVDGRHYWDAEMRSNTLLPDVMTLLGERLPPAQTPDEFLVVVVDMLSGETDKVPASTMESLYRFMNILLGDKLKYEQREFDVGNAYLASLERLQALAESEPRSPLSAAVEDEYRKALTHCRAHVEVLHIGRRQFEYEHISRDFDFSPQYIARLIEQGSESAEQAIDSYQQQRRGLSEPPIEHMQSARFRDGDERQAYSRPV